MDDQTRIELEAAAFRTLRHHLMEKRTDVQNIDMMNMTGFCRNCLSRWYQEAYVRYFVARWSYSTALHSLELANENNFDAKAQATAFDIAEHVLRTETAAIAAAARRWAPISTKSAGRSIATACTAWCGGSAKRWMSTRSTCRWTFPGRSCKTSPANG